MIILDRMQQRIQKIMAQSGIASRRKCEELIKKGLVKVNGKTAKLGDKASNEDRIELDGKLIKEEKKVYVILNKPKGVICSVNDKFGRKTVIDLIKCNEKIFPAGRLDLDSEGLLILTNDGDLANRIIHPRYNVKKTYTAVLDRRLTENDIERIRKGIRIDGRKVNVLDLSQNKNEIKIGIHEGRKHIVKRIFEQLGHKVISLKRISIGKLRLELSAGQYKFVDYEWLNKNIF